jgi:hypothetical protein
VRCDSEVGDVSKRRNKGSYILNYYTAVIKWYINYERYKEGDEGAET